MKAESEVALLPCPFCGAVPTLTSRVIDIGSMDTCMAFWVKCENVKCSVGVCTSRYGPSRMTSRQVWGAGGKESDEAAKQGVIEGWNTRAT